jgi:hypothetical protein
MEAICQNCDKTKPQKETRIITIQLKRSIKKKEYQIWCKVCIKDSLDDFCNSCEKTLTLGSNPCQSCKLLLYQDD